MQCGIAANGRGGYFKLWMSTLQRKLTGNLEGMYLQSWIYSMFLIMLLQVMSRCILPKGPYLPCVSMAGRARLAGYHRCMTLVKCCNGEWTLFWYFVQIFFCNDSCIVTFPTLLSICWKSIPIAWWRFGQSKDRSAYHMFNFWKFQLSKCFLAATKQL